MRFDDIIHSSDPRCGRVSMAQAAATAIERNFYVLHPYAQRFLSRTDWQNDKIIQLNQSNPIRPLSSFRSTVRSYVRPYVYPSFVRPFVRPSVRPSVHPSIRPSIAVANYLLYYSSEACCRLTSQGLDCVKKYDTCVTHVSHSDIKCLGHIVVVVVVAGRFSTTFTKSFGR